MEKLYARRNFLLRKIKNRFYKQKIIDNTIIRDNLSDIDITIITKRIPSLCCRTNFYRTLGDYNRFISSKKHEGIVIDSVRFTLDSELGFWADIAYLNEKKKEDIKNFPYLGIYSVRPSSDKIKEELKNLEEAIVGETYNLEKSLGRNERLSLFFAEKRIKELLIKEFLMSKGIIYLGFSDLERRIKLSSPLLDKLYKVLNISCDELLKLLKQNGNPLFGNF